MQVIKVCPCGRRGRRGWWIGIEAPDLPGYKVQRWFCTTKCQHAMVALLRPVIEGAWAPARAGGAT